MTFLLSILTVASLLDSPVYSEREAAINSLSQLSYKQINSIKPWSINSRHGLERAKNLYICRKIKSIEYFPFIDSAWFDPEQKKYVDKAVFYGYTEENLRKYIDHNEVETELYSRYRTASLRWFTEMIKDDVSINQIKEMANELKRRDEIYLSQKNKFSLPQIWGLSWNNLK